MADMSDLLGESTVEYFVPPKESQDKMERMNMQAFDNPVPGESMTSQLGAADYERPPRYTSLEEVTDFIFQRLSDESVQMELFNLIDAGVPVAVMVEPILLNMTRKGIMNMDLAMLAAEPTALILYGFAKQAGLNPTLTPEKENIPTITESQYQEIRKIFKKKDVEKRAEENEEKVNNIDKNSLLVGAK